MHATKRIVMGVICLAAAVENLTIDGGYLTSGNGAGAYVTAGTLQDCEIMNCSEYHWGGVSGCGVYATRLHSPDSICFVLKRDSSFAFAAAI